MSNEFELNPAHQELERALGSLKPAPLRLDRDRLMFQAGRASAVRRPMGWPLLSGALALMLFFSWGNRMEDGKELKNPHIAPDPIQAKAPVEYNHWAIMSTILSDENESGAVPENSYWQLRKQVALYGVDTLRQKASELQSHSPQAWKLYNRMKSPYRDQNL